MKDVLVTGASRGIGFALTEQFLRNNYRVFCASRNLESLKKLQNLYADRCLLIDLDLTSQESIAVASRIIGEKSEGLSIVINNSGAIINKPFGEISREELQNCYDVNVLGPYQLVQKLQNCIQPNAHFVFISSMGGFQGTQKFAGLTAYSSSKAAVASLTECLQEEFKDSQLAFNCLCLGAVQTEMLQTAFPGYQALLNPKVMSDYIYQFSTTANKVLKGKIIPISLSNP